MPNIKVAGAYDGDVACETSQDKNQRPTLSLCASGRLVLSHSTTPGAYGTISLTDLIAPAMMRLTASIGWTFNSRDDDLEGGG